MKCSVVIKRLGYEASAGWTTDGTFFRGDLAPGEIYKSGSLCETLPALQDEQLTTDPYI